MQALELFLYGCLEHKPNAESLPAITQVRSKTPTELTKMRVWPTDCDSQLSQLCVQLLPHCVASKEYTHMLAVMMLLFGLPDVQIHRYNPWVDLFPFFLEETIANVFLL